MWFVALRLLFPGFTKRERRDAFNVEFAAATTSDRWLSTKLAQTALPERSRAAVRFKVVEIGAALWRLVPDYG